MTIYTTRPEGFAEIRKQVLLKGIPTLLLSLGVGIGISYYTSGSTAEQDAGTLPILVPFMMAVVGFSVYRSLKQQKQLYESYTLSIFDDQIVREMHNTPTITLPVGDITAITRNHNGSFTIQGSKALNVIGVYPQIQQYDALEAQLQELHPVTIQAKEPIIQTLRLPIILFTLGLMAVVFLAPNKVLVGVSGFSLTGLMGWSFVYMQRSPNIDRTTKRMGWLMLPVVLSIIGTTVSKLLA